MHIIKPQENTLWRVMIYSPKGWWDTRWSVMICQICGLDKKSRTKMIRLFGWAEVDSKRVTLSNPLYFQDFQRHVPQTLQHIFYSFTHLKLLFNKAYGLTAKKRFFKSLKAFIYKGFSVFLFGPYFSPKSLGFICVFPLFWKKFSFNPVLLEPQCCI